MKKMLAALLAVVMAVPLGADATLREHERIPLVESRSYGTNTYSACVTLGNNGEFTNPWIVGRGRVRTTGSSTTVTGFNTALDVFAAPAAGDSIRFHVNNGQAKPLAFDDPFRQIATNADDDTITVNRAIDLDPTSAGADATGYPFVYRTLNCSTSAGANYVPVQGWTAGNFLVIAESESSATGGLDYRIEAYSQGAANDPQIIAEGNLSQSAIAAGGPSAHVNLGEYNFGTFGWTHVRILVKVSAGTVVYSVYGNFKN